MLEQKLVMRRVGRGGATEEVSTRVDLDDQKSIRGLFQAAAVCPIRWRDIVEPSQAILEATLNGFELALGLLGREFEHYWYRVATEFDADDEAEYFIGIDADEPEWQLRAGAVNLLRWYPLAEKEYLNRMGRFVHLRFADDKDQGKHYSPPGKPDEAVRSDTKRKDSASLLYERMRPEVMTELMWQMLLLDVSSELPTEYRLEIDTSPMGLVWEKLLPPTGHHKVLVRSDEPIGATGGLETEWLLFDCDMSTPQAHAFPVPAGYANYDTLVAGGFLYLTPMWQRRARMELRRGQ